MSKASPILTLQDITKYFSLRKTYRGFLSSVRNFVSLDHYHIKAVDGISFSIDPGEIVGYLGPNGAGKSTTIKMLTGLLVPTSGTISVNGYVPWKDRQIYVAGIGAVFGQRTTLWWDLPVIESFDLIRHIYKMPFSKYKKNLNEFTTLLDLDGFLDKPVRTLSLGQRMRADLCAALLHEPGIVFLDEPTIGLDVVAKESIRKVILHINKEHNTTIVLTTHDISDVEKLCQRVLIIDMGKLLYDGLLDTLKERFGGERKLVVDFAQEYTNYQIESAEIESQVGKRITYLFRRGEITASELIQAISARYRIEDLQVREPDIETTIRRIYEEKLLSDHPGV